MSNRARSNSGRRNFLRASAVVGTAAALLPLAETAAASPGQHDANRVRRYVKLGRTDLEISDISFGSSRLRLGQEDLVRHALDRGVNYFDTADSYTGGDAEVVLGNALKGQRDNAYLASKTKASHNDDWHSIMRALEGSLARLQTDHVDVYFNHAVNELDRLKNPEWFEFADRAKSQGKIRYTGMSGHAGHLAECLDYAIEQNLIDVMLAAYNFGQDPAFYESLSRSFDFVATQPKLPGVLRRAKARGVGVIAMKVLRGARLNDMRPFEAGENTFAQAAFRWTLSNPDVDAAIISMTQAAVIDEYLGASGAQRLAFGDRELLQRYASMTGTTYCNHACNDCAGACPHGVPIADVLRTRMYATDYRDVDFARREYAELTTNASACLTCSGQPCQAACSHGLRIDKLCAPTHRMLA